MTKFRLNLIFSFFLCIATFHTATALPLQPLPQPKVKVALIAPIYLDSVFSGTTYRYGKKFPRFAVPGIEFVQGAMVALDSMPNTAKQVDVSIFDCASAGQTIETLIQQKRLDSFQLIIGSVRDQDYLQLANFSSTAQIPFISVSYPNDGGITSNPFLTILNSTLRTHCEAIYAYLLQNHNDTTNILFCRQPGTQEDRVQQYFNDINAPDGSPLMHLKHINFTDSNFNSIKPMLDSTKQNIVIAGSLDEYFANKIALQCYGLLKQYRIKLIGMPNWDAFRSLVKNETLKNFPVYFTSPFYNNRQNSYSQMLTDLYLKKYKGYPTDFCYKGFEAAYLFIPLLLKHPNDFSSHLNDFQQKIFSDFIFKPVINSDTGLPDYMENKHLYFLQIKDGQITRAW